MIYSFSGDWKNSNDCLEDCRNPIAERLIAFDSINTLRLEGSDMILKHSEESKLKMSNTMKGRTSKLKGRVLPEETKLKMRLNVQRGPHHHNWNGGKKLAIARHGSKRRNKGFVLITNKNPYDETIEYHHIHPDLPYVIPCPERIHGMFFGADITHYDNVNLIVGVKVPPELLTIKSKSIMPEEPK